MLVLSYIYISWHVFCYKYPDNDKTGGTNYGSQTNCFLW